MSELEKQALYVSSSKNTRLHSSYKCMACARHCLRQTNITLKRKDIFLPNYRFFFAQIRNKILFHSQKTSSIPPPRNIKWSASYNFVGDRHFQLYAVFKVMVRPCKKRIYLE